MLTPDIGLPIILIVDDHDAFRSTLGRLFKECRYRVVEASNGKEAIEAASSECPDVIVMDINMPVTDGLTATTIIRRLGGRHEIIPIIALSANGPETRSQALAAGCNYYFNKNEIDRLISAIEHILRNP